MSEALTVELFMEDGAHEKSPFWMNQFAGDGIVVVRAGAEQLDSGRIQVIGQV